MIEVINCDPKESYSYIDNKKKTSLAVYFHLLKNIILRQMKNMKYLHTKKM